MCGWGRLPGRAVLAQSWVAPEAQPGLEVGPGLPCLRDRRGDSVAGTEKDVPRVFFFFFKWPHPWHMEVPRPGIESEL